MCRIKCETEEGFAPGERLAIVQTAEGENEEVSVANSFIESRGEQHCLRAYEIERDKGKSKTLVELPRETSSGRWRIWVNDAMICE